MRNKVLEVFITNFVSRKSFILVNRHLRPNASEYELMIFDPSSCQMLWNPKQVMRQYKQVSNSLGVRCFPHYPDD